MSDSDHVHVHVLVLVLAAESGLSPDSHDTIDLRRYLELGYVLPMGRCV